MRTSENLFDASTDEMHQNNIGVLLLSRPLVADLTGRPRSRPARRASSAGQQTPAQIPSVRKSQEEARLLATLEIPSMSSNSVTGP